MIFLRKATAIGLIWHIPLLIATMLVAVIATPIIHTFNTDTDYYVKASEVAATEAAYLK